MDYLPCKKKYLLGNISTYNKGKITRNAKPKADDSACFTFEKTGVEKLRRRESGWRFHYTMQRYLDYIGIVFFDMLVSDQMLQAHLIEHLQIGVGRFDQD